MQLDAAQNKMVKGYSLYKDKYNPIFMHDKEASILGIAVGIIKNK